MKNKIKLPNEKLLVDFSHCGNTVSSTIPIVIESAIIQGKVGKGHRIMLVGFGVGYSWGATFVEL